MEESKDKLERSDSDEGKADSVVAKHDPYSELTAEAAREVDKKLLRKLGGPHADDDSKQMLIIDLKIYT